MTDTAMTYRKCNLCRIRWNAPVNACPECGDPGIAVAGPPVSGCSCSCCLPGNPCGCRAYAEGERCDCGRCTATIPGPGQ